MNEESLLDLLKDVPHWQFEILSHLVVDAVLAGIFYPAIRHLIKDHKNYHKSNG